MNTPDFLPAFAEELRRRGAHLDDIVRFVAHCEGLPPDIPEAPCPLCFLTNKTSHMSALRPADGEQRFFCPECRERLVVNAPWR